MPVGETALGASNAALRWVSAEPRRTVWGNGLPVVSKEGWPAESAEGLLDGVGDVETLPASDGKGVEDEGPPRLDVGVTIRLVVVLV